MSRSASPGRGSARQVTLRDQPQQDSVNIQGMNIQLTNGQDATIHVARNPDGTVRVSPLTTADSRWQNSIVPRVPFYRSEHMMKVALHQAQERTRLLVECVALMKNIKALDQEMMWFAEGNDAWTQDGPIAGGAMLARRFNVACPKCGAQSQVEEMGSLMGHLGRAKSCAEVEAGVWRQRAIQLAHAAGESERGAAARLMSFELPTAVRAFLDRRSTLQTLERRLHEQDFLLERMRDELGTAQDSSDSSRGAAEEAQRRADEQHALAVERQASLQEQSATCGELGMALATTQSKLQEQSATCEALNRGLANKDQELAAMRRQLDRYAAEVAQLRGENQRAQEETKVLRQENQRAHEDIKRAHKELGVADVELTAVRRDLSKATVNADAFQAEARRIAQELSRVNNDCQSRVLLEDAVRSLTSQRDSLTAELRRRENLEAELGSSHSKQAHLSPLGDPGAHSRTGSSLTAETRRRENLEAELGSSHSKRAHLSPLGDPGAHSWRHQLAPVGATQELALPTPGRPTSARAGGPRRPLTARTPPVRDRGAS